MTFGGIAVVLAVIGVFGVFSYSVARRTHEIGIQIALGAAQRHTLGMVFRDGAVVAAGGLALGLAPSLALTRLLKNQLYSVRATDATTFVAVSAALALTAGLAMYVPARRASRIDPLVALR